MIGTASAEIKLLPGDQAFRYAARALDATTLEAQFTIADGYYLYRDKLRFAVEPCERRRRRRRRFRPARSRTTSSSAGWRPIATAWSCAFRCSAPPPGKRSRCAPSRRAAPTSACATRPAVQRLAVVIPAPGQPAGPLVEATPAKKGWFK